MPIVGFKTINCFDLKINNPKTHYDFCLIDMADEYIPTWPITYPCSYNWSQLKKSYRTEWISEEKTIKIPR